MLFPAIFLDWTSVPTFESFVYHVREIDGDGAPGNVVLQHRAGMVRGDSVVILLHFVSFSFVAFC